MSKLSGGSGVRYRLSVFLRRTARRLSDLFRAMPARRIIGCAEGYTHLVAEHSSTLIKKVRADLMDLQRNKVHNLKLASAAMDGLLLRPGAIFSFCSLVGPATCRRGYRDGLQLVRGELRAAPGGGLCQLANLVYWMGLHAGMEVLERHHHCVDLFPDDGRTVPFGMGVSIFYNYMDLRLRNGLDQPLLLRVGVEPPLLVGRLLSDSPFDKSISIYQSRHRFFRDSGGTVWRENCVRRRVKDPSGPDVDEEIAHNIGRVLYDVSGLEVEGENSCDPRAP